ncbi:4160_t:CDS:2, partial [Gigaspora margarita]
SSLSLSSISTLFQTNQGEDSYNYIIYKLARSLEVQEELIELLKFKKELIESLEVQEEDKENKENIEFDILKNLINGLKLYQIKNKHNMSEAAFNEIFKVLEIPEISLYKFKKYLENLVPLKLILVDCCINLCIVFIGDFVNKNICTICKEPCYKFDKYKDKARAKTLHYQHNYMSLYDYAFGNKIGNKFDSFRYKSLVSSEFFLDYQNVGLIVSTNGYQIFCQKQDDN